MTASSPLPATSSPPTDGGTTPQDDIAATGRSDGAHTRQDWSMALSCAAPVVELDAVSPIRSRTVVVTSTMLNRRIHPRGNLEAFTQAASEAKRREIHDLGRCVHFYTDYGVRLQQRFLGRSSREWIPNPTRRNRDISI